MQQKILVVEDDLYIQEMIEFILTAEGYSVVCASDDSFIENLIDINPSLILLDNQLAGSYGKDLCLKIKEGPATKKFPVVLLSANSAIENLALESNADGFLAKPFDVDELVTITSKFTP